MSSAAGPSTRAGVFASSRWAGRRRVIALVVLAGAAIVDLVALAILLLVDDPSDDGPPEVATPSAADVARTVVRAVAESDCSDLDAVLADGADLPFAVTACVTGDPAAIDLTDVEVLGTVTEGADAVVRVGVNAEGQPAEIVLELRRDSGGWQVTSVRSTE